MSKPSIDNIDKWLFESAEGTLSAAQEEMLDAFLLQNPAFVEEQELWSEATVTPEEVVFPNIDRLLVKPVWQRPVFYFPAAALLLIGMVYGGALFLGDTQDGVLAVVQNENLNENENQKLKENEAAEGSSVDNGTRNQNQNQNETAEGSSLDYEARNQNQNEKLKENETAEGNSVAMDARNQELSQDEVFVQKENINVAQNKDLAKNETVVRNQNGTQNEKPNGNQNEKLKENETAEGKSVSNVARNQNKSEKGLVLNEKVEKSLSAKENIDGVGKNSDAADEVSLVGVETPFETVAEKLELDELKSHLLDRNLLEERLATIYSAKSTLKGEHLAVRGPRITTENAYKNSVSSRMKRFGRKIVRMMDNPLALKNAKDLVYHVPNMQTLDVAFASVGSGKAPRLQSISRAQYLGYDNQHIMNQLAFDTYVRSIRGGLGVQVNHNYYGKGAYQTSQFAFTYSPKIGVNKNVVIEPGFRFKMGNTQLNSTKVTPGQFVEVERFNSQVFFPNGSDAIGSQLWYQDLGFGLLANTKWFTAGVQLDNLTRHYENVYNNLKPLGRRAPLHFTATLGTEYVSRDKNISFSPYTFYQKMENLSEIWAGSIFRYKKFTLGGAYSSLGDFAGSIGLKTKLVMITYGVDYTTSSLYDTRLLSHQLSLRILFNNGSLGQGMLKL